MKGLFDSYVLDRIALALEYPGDAGDVGDRIHGAVTAHAELDDALRDLADHSRRVPLGERQETYTRLFDLDARCSLHAGHHIFGDAYERGALLAGLAVELRTRGIDPAPELPDHLPVLLRLLGRIEDPEDRQTLLEAVVVPGLEAMKAKLTSVTHPWARVVCALSDALAAEARQVPPTAEVARKEALHA